jgi:hypothetical protein
MFDVMGPLPGPQQLPVLANITIEPGRFPDWEQQCSTTEAYARRPPPGVTISPPGPDSKPPMTNSLDAAPPMAYSTSQDPHAPQMGQPYASPPYHPRDLERRNPIQYSPQQPYGQERHQYYDGRPGQARPSYPPPPGVSYTANGGPPNPNDPYYSAARRERSPPRDGQPQYLASPPMQYPRDRYPENPPSYTPPNYAHPWAGQGQYRAPPEIRTTFDDSTDSISIVDHGNGKVDDQQLSVSRLPPTPNSANPASPLSGPSPKLSINNNLLNPSEEAGRNTLTLPPLSRMGEAGSPISSSGRKSPIGEILPSEDARQLDGLGRRV